MLRYSREFQTQMAELTELPARDENEIDYLQVLKTIGKISPLSAIPCQFNIN